MEAHMRQYGSSRFSGLHSNLVCVPPNGLQLDREVFRSNGEVCREDYATSQRHLES